MFLTGQRLARRFLNSPYNVFRRPPKPNKWLTRERVFRFTGWLYSDARDKYTIALQFLAHSWVRQTRQREELPALQNWYYKKRIGAALEEHRMTLPVFQEMLEKANIRLNLQMLSFLALYEPASFKSLAMLTRQMALNENVEGISSKEPLPENVVIPKKL